MTAYSPWFRGETDLIPCNIKKSNRCGYTPRTRWRLYYGQ